MKLDFEYLKKEILNYKAKSEYKQASIVILRNIFKEAETKQCAIHGVVNCNFYCSDYSKEQKPKCKEQCVLCMYADT